MHDYYHAIEDKLIPESPETITVDLLKHDDELPDIEKVTDGHDITLLSSYSYPRLDELFKKALKAQVVPDITATAADAGKKGGAAAKGGKDAKGAKGGAEEANKPDSVYV